MAEITNIPVFTVAYSAISDAFTLVQSNSYSDLRLFCATNTLNQPVELALVSSSVANAVLPAGQGITLDLGASKITWWDGRLWVKTHGTATSAGELNLTYLQSEYRI